MARRLVSAVTGGFSYTGRYLTRRLLDEGQSVVNLTSHPARLTDFSDAELKRVSVHPLAFDAPDRLERALAGVDVLYCTYFIRFAVGDMTHARAVDNLATLFDAAKRAGVRKVVLSSHTHASEDSPYPYIANKARGVAALRSSGLDYAVVRPCGIFGDSPTESILINNAAWVLRRSPLFLLAGDGNDRFQPIHVRDMAALMHELGASHSTGEERDACGPEAPTALELFRAIARACGSPALVAAPGLSTRVVTALTQPLNWYTGDILLDTDDLEFLCGGLTVADDPHDPAIASRRSLFAWLEESGPRLGERYVSSFSTYYDTTPAPAARAK